MNGGPGDGDGTDRGGATAGASGVGGSGEASAAAGPPTTGRGPRVVWAIAWAEIRRYLHRHTATRRKRALLLVGAVALVPAWGFLFPGAYAAGTSAAAGGLTDLPHVARWWLPAAMAMFALQGAFLTNHLLEFEARKLLLATVPDRTLSLGLLGATLWTIGVYTAIPLGALFGAFGLGAGSVGAALLGWAAGVVVLFASYLVGTAGGLAARLALLRVPMTSDARNLYGTVAKSAMMVGFGALGAFGGSRLGDVEDAKLGLSLLAPEGPTPVPLGHAADWLFVATPLVDGISMTAAVAGLAVLATIPLSAAAIARLAPKLWYADPAQPDDEEEAAETATLPSFLDGGRLPVAGRTGVVVDGLVRRVGRQPERLAFVAYYLFVPVIMGVSFVAGDTASVPTAAGGMLVIVGLWLAGGVFCLNPLGEEGTMLGQLVLAETPPRTLVRARLLAGTLVGAPLVLVGTGLLAVDAFPVARAAAFGAYWLALVPSSAGLALGLGTLLPNTETRRLLDAIEVHAPETLAIVYHAVLVLALAAAGPLLARSSLDPTVTWSLAGALAVSVVVLGHGGYRFAVSGLADHGRPRRPDRVFTAELATGLALAGLLLSTSAGLGAVVLSPLDGLAGFVVAFLAGYVGWATVVVAYLLTADRTDYLDVRWPTRADLRTAAAGTGALLGLWALVTVGVELLDLPVSRHSLGGAIDAGGPELVVALVALALLVNGPVEELLFRNVVQKRLAEAFDRRRALAGASALFALVHLPVYAGGGPVGAAVALGMLALLGAVLGAVYDRTGTVVVPALCHGVYNAALFVLVYVLAA